MASIDLYPHRVDRVLGFSPCRPNLDPPPPHPQASVSPPPLVRPNSDEGTDTVGLEVRVLCVYPYGPTNKESMLSRQSTLSTFKMCSKEKCKNGTVYRVYRHCLQMANYLFSFSNFKIQFHIPLCVSYSAVCSYLYLSSLDYCFFPRMKM